MLEQGLRSGPFPLRVGHRDRISLTRPPTDSSHVGLGARTRLPAVCGRRDPRTPTLTADDFGGLRGDFTGATELVIGRLSLCVELLSFPSAQLTGTPPPLHRRVRVTAVGCSPAVGLGKAATLQGAPGPHASRQPVGTAGQRRDTGGSRLPWTRPRSLEGSVCKHLDVSSEGPGWAGMQVSRTPASPDTAAPSALCLTRIALKECFGTTVPCRMSQRNP